MKWWCVWIVLFVSSNIFAQTHQRSSEIVDHISEAMCKCVNDALLNIDDEVKELVGYALLDSANGSQHIQSYLQNATTERAAEVIQQLQYFGALDSKMNTCISESTDVYQQFKFELDDLSYPEQGIVLMDFYDNQKTIEKLLNNLLLLEGCEFAHQFIRFGIELEKK
ncbi:MAG TPA: hypothetical protein VL443_12375 [Cyclobacteriaceae bacterium]|jgi:hypothetical protein|nr:hypothetical protein [Cyclobacteriaceae bacterium]